MEEKKIEAQNSVRNVPSAQNHMYEEKIGYEEAVDYSKIASPKRSRVLTVQDKVIKYFNERNRKASVRGVLKPSESAEWIGPRTYALMARTNERPIPLDTDGKNGLPESETAASVDMLKSIPGRLLELFIGNAYLKDVDQEALSNTRMCLW